MTNELELWQFIADRISVGETAVLLVVVDSTGSSPGRVGFKMAATADDMCGSIGGGVMEVALVERARLLCLDKAKSQEVLKRVHRKNDVNSSGMICSGEQVVLVQEISHADNETVSELIDALNSGCSTAIEITRLGIALCDIRDRKAWVESGSDYRYYEKLGLRDQLIIVGGGHCALALSRIMSGLGFRITLFDDRPNLNTLKKNKYVNRIEIIDNYEAIGDLIASDENTYVVVMTIGFANDKAAVSGLIGKDYRYFGVLGSKAKMAVLIKELKDEGLEAVRVDRIHTPIGLEINSRTPEEIAVSIAAEIILEKNS